MSAEIYNFTDWIKNVDTALLFHGLSELLEQSGYTIINYIDHNFSPKGYTCVWLLAESHLAIHTFPEANKTYIELSSCNNLMNEKFKQLYTAWKNKFSIS